MCLNEGVFLPFFILWCLSLVREVQLMICFVDAFQTLSCPTTHDRWIINPNAETGLKSLQEYWGVSEG